MLTTEREKEEWGVASCRDKGMRGGDVGALCLSSSQDDDSAKHHVMPLVSRCDEDKHKAPTRPLIRPLSLQDGSPSLPCSVGKNHQDEDAPSYSVGNIHKIR